MNIKRSIKVMGAAAGLSMAVVAVPSHALLGGLTGGLTGGDDALGGLTDTVTGTLGDGGGLLGGSLLGGLDLGGASPLDVLAGGDILGGTSLLGDLGLGGLTGGLGGAGGVAMLPGTLANIGGSGGTLGGILGSLPIGGSLLGIEGISLPGIPDPNSFNGGIDGIFGVVSQVVAAGPAGALTSVSSLLDQTPVTNCVDIGRNVNLNNGAVFQQHNVLAAFGGTELWSYDRDADGNLCLAEITRGGGNGDNLGIIPEAQNLVNLGRFSIHEGGQRRYQNYVFMVNPGPGINQSGIIPSVLDTIGSAPTNLLLGGNSTVSVFRVGRNGTELTDIEDIGGPNGRSVAVDTRNNRIYTVAAGSQLELFGAEVCLVNENIRGFDFNPSTGQLIEIGGSTVETDDCAGDPGSLDISSDGRFLAVSQRNTTFATVAGPEPDRVEVFPIDLASGRPGNPVVTVTAPPESGDELGDSPFGARFLTERFNGRSNLRFYQTFGFGQAPNNGDIGAFAVNGDGTLSGIGGENGSGVTRTRGSDNCWNVITNPVANNPSQRYMYTSAFFDSSVLQHPIDRATGQLLDDEAFDNGRSTVASSRPDNDNVFAASQGGLDIAITRPGGQQNLQQYVYVNNNPTPLPVPFVTSGAIDPGLTNIEAFRVLPNGSLERMPDTRINGLTSRHQGLVAW